MSNKDTGKTVSKGKPQSRQAWGSQYGFLIAAIGSAIGLGNIWRFPGVAFSNGGGAFLIPYVIALLTIGFPMLMLEYAMGHKFRGSPPLALARLNRRIEVVGWWQVGICLIIILYYAVIIAWALRYMFYSFTMAWGDDPTTFFIKSFLENADPTTVSFKPVWQVLIPLVAVWVVTIFLIARGVQRGIEWATRICIPVLVVLFIAMVIRAVTLPGATDGLNALFTPKWSALADGSVWIAAVAQIFFSMSVGFGIMLTYASYLRKKSNLTGSGLVAGFANSSFELLAGIGVFATLGFMAHQQHVQVSELKGLTGVALSFMTFPAIINQMPGGIVFGVLFFGSLVLAGITSLVSLVQVVTGALQDKLGVGTVKSSVTVGIICAIISASLFATTTGLSALDTVDKYINDIGVVGAAVSLCLVVTVITPSLRALRVHLNVTSTIKMGKLWEAMVGFVIPVLLMSMLIKAASDLIRNGYDAYSRTWTNSFGWGFLVVVLIFALIMSRLKWKKGEEVEPKLELENVNWKAEED